MRSLLTRNPVEVLADLEGKLAKRQGDLREHDAAKPAESDLEAMDAWIARRVPLETLVRTAERAVAAQRPAAEEHEARVRADAARAEEVQIERESKALARRIEAELPKLSAQFAALIQATVEDAARVKAINLRRQAAGLPMFWTAEELARRSEARTVPARTRREKVWLDPKGERCAGLVPNAETGELVPQHPGAYRLTEVEVVERHERREPARTPKRLADAVVLPGLKHGEAMAWPPRSITS